MSATAFFLPLLVPNTWMIKLLEADESTVTGPADALVVLGGGLTKGGDLGVTTVERLDRASDLHRRGTTVFVTGGPGTAPRMKRYLVEKGLPATDIKVDKSSFSTWDNVKRLCPDIKAGGFEKIVVITSPYHSGRALRLFENVCPGPDYRAVSTAPTKLFEGKSWFHVKTALLCEAAKGLYSFFR